MNKIIEFISLGNSERGFLSYFESSNDISFEIRRIYYIYDVPVGETRGFHAHKKLKQLIWCPSGSVDFLVDDGKNRTKNLLDAPNKAFFMSIGYWREITFLEENSVLCVAASDYYDESDYIRDYDEFLEYVKKGYWNEN